MPGRTRLNTDSVISTSRSFKYDLGNDHAVFTYTTPAPTWPTRSFYMSDYVGNPHGVNPVYQVVLESDANRLVDFEHSNGAAISQLGDFPVLIDSSQMHTNGMIITPTAAQFSSWSVDAFNAFHDQVPREFSVGNFLFELRDIKGMIPKIERSISKTASSNFLAFEFGVKPFIGDVGKMLTLMEMVTKRLKHLRDTIGKEVTLSFSRKVEEPIGPTVLSIPAPDWGAGANFEFRRLNYSGKFTATSKLIQNLDNLSDQSSALKGYAAALGLNNPIAIVWEAIPYSFVIDWFFKVGKLLDSLAIQPFGGEWTLRNTTSSFKDEYLYLVSQDFFPSRNVKTQLGQARIRRYSRSVGLPVSSVFATDLTLTPKQQALSLALLNQLR